MARSSSSLPVVVVAALLVATAGSGCGPTPEQQMKDAYRKTYSENGRRLVALYTRFMATPSRPVSGPHDFKGPADESEFRAFIRKLPQESLADIGITNPDAEELFKSERDGQPFRIRYGIKGGLNTVYAVLCETQGVSGKIRVYTSNGSFMEVAADAAEASMSGKQDQQPPNQL